MNTTEIKRIGYTTYGSIRGQCAHLHRTLEGAERCASRDLHLCGAQSRGSYSDRVACEVGSDGYLYRDISVDEWIPGDGGRSSGAARFRR